jgi:hypothetical protein
MSRPRFLADNDLNDAIVVGVRRRGPALEFSRGEGEKDMHFVSRIGQKSTR